VSSILDKILRSDSDKDVMLSTIVNSGYTSAKVVGRGTLVVDSSEVAESDEFKRYTDKAKKIIAAKKDKAP